MNNNSPPTAQPINSANTPYDEGPFTIAQPELPPLPKPAVLCGEYAGPPGEGADDNYFTWDQLINYARAALAAQAVQLFDFEKQMAERDTRISVLTDAAETLLLLVGLTAFKHEAQRAVLQQAFDGMRAAIAQPNGK